VKDGARIIFTGAFNFVGPFGSGIGGIYTVPDARGKGLAQRATAELARIALADGPVVTLHVDPANAPAIRAYQKAGFRAVGKFRLTFR
jgi:predicted GNAT family acetyltransferase